VNISFILCLCLTAVTVRTGRRNSHRTSQRFYIKTNQYSSKPGRI